MSTTYKSTPGDTFALISRKVYGTEAGTVWLRGANTGVSEPIPPGTQLVVPDLPARPRDNPQSILSGGLNDVSLFIDGERFRNWQSISIERSLDSMDTFSVYAAFNRNDATQRRLFAPFKFRPITVQVGGDALFTGNAVKISPLLDWRESSVFLSGYARAGALNDCTVPRGASAETSFNGQGLDGIAEALCGYFGLAPKFVGNIDDTSTGYVWPIEEHDPLPFGADVFAPQAPVSTPTAGNTGAPFPDGTRIKPDQKVLSFLATLAQQRGFVIGSDTDGNPIFRRPQVTARVATLEEKKAPLVELRPEFDPQAYYSELTAYKSATTAGLGTSYTYRNPHLNDIVRPLVFRVSDTAEGDVQQALLAEAGRMYANMVSYTAVLSSWRDDAGNLWEPGAAIEVLAPGAMIYQPYPFVIRSVSFYKDEKTETATLNLIIPGSLSGSIPAVLPWD